MKIPKIDQTIAWNTTQAMLIAVGSVETVALAATMQWFLIVALGASLGISWGVLYKMLDAMSARRQGAIRVQNERN